MVISHAKKFIFLHLPKNAGTSIEEALTGSNDWKAADKHLTAKECIERYGHDVWREYFTFCVVRNPWDRLVSQYRFNGETWCKRHFGEPLGFNDFVKKVVAAGLPFSRHDYQSKIGNQTGDPQWDQLSRIADNRGEVLVDYVGRFERLQADFDVICDKIGMPRRELSLSNPSGSDKTGYSRYYDREAADIVASVFADEIALFGYKFEGSTK